MKCLMHSVCHEIRFFVMYCLWVCAAVCLFMYWFINFLDFAVEDYVTFCLQMGIHTGKIFFSSYISEIQKGPFTKSYMRKGFLIHI